jgi:serine/threonine protein kinase
MGLRKAMLITISEFAYARSPCYYAPKVEDRSMHSRSADIFSLGAVFLEMLVAHSYPQERPALKAILISKGDRSYAKSVE